MINTLFLCITVIIVSYLVTHSTITVNINHNTDYVEPVHKETNLYTQEELDRAVQESSNNNFDEVIKTINAEFGGVDIGENETT